LKIDPHPNLRFLAGVQTEFWTPNCVPKLSFGTRENKARSLLPERQTKERPRRRANRQVAAKLLGQPVDQPQPQGAGALPI